MQARTIDPRDQTTEVVDPAYRVFFWTGMECEAWELSEADLDEVLSWIAANSAGRMHSLWAVTRSLGEVELVRLRGFDPTAPVDTWPRWSAETPS
ncbi:MULTISPECIES: hypothetical protein [unclassified Salinibacterium]|uniref:hypothetical protein n=1 Tax=unclassified Salinibacterium TaxID=2632331 RepID=UPI001422803D|nr:MULTISPECIES: hypothetical protein [unclassified Salinibacterium]